MMIPPTLKGSKIPPIWKEPRLWYRLLQIRYGAWDMNRTQFVYLWKTSFNCRKRNFDIAHPRHRLDFHDLEALALVLYQKMNTAFAAYSPSKIEGLIVSGSYPKEIGRIQAICGQTFAESLIAAMNARDPSQKMTWKWEKELSRPKVVSFVCHPIIQGQHESDLIQAVVRIHGQEVLYFR
jgi:hypothetical protein